MRPGVRNCRPRGDGDTNAPAADPLTAGGRFVAVRGPPAVNGLHQQLGYLIGRAPPARRLTDRADAPGASEMHARVCSVEEEVVLVHKSVQAGQARLIEAMFVVAHAAQRLTTIARATEPTVQQARRVPAPCRLRLRGGDACITRAQVVAGSMMPEARAAQASGVGKQKQAAALICADGLSIRFPSAGSMRRGRRLRHPAPAARQNAERSVRCAGDRTPACGWKAAGQLPEQSPGRPRRAREAGRKGTHQRREGGAACERALVHRQLEPPARAWGA
jgi:hypothetical protein